MRFEKLDLNLLVALETLVETQSVSETAVQLNLSQSATSAALKRLREYFNDDLVVQVGRTMVPTAKGIEIAQAATDMLNVARFSIVKTKGFDPATSKRRFRIIASDYVFDVLIAKVIAEISQFAPHIEFEMLPIVPEFISQFDKGKIDVQVTVKQFIVDEHPCADLFVDSDVVIGWNAGRFSNGVSEKEFKKADFATAIFGAERRLTLSQLHFKAIGVQLNTSVQVSSFSALPASVVGTNRLAVIHRRHAELFQALYPIVLHPLPVEGAEVVQVAQWHRLRENDAGIVWLLEKLQRAAKLI